MLLNFLRKAVAVLMFSFFIASCASNTDSVLEIESFNIDGVQQLNGKGKLYLYIDKVEYKVYLSSYVYAVNQLYTPPPAELTYIKGDKMGLADAVFQGVNGMYYVSEEKNYVIFKKVDNKNTVIKARVTQAYSPEDIKFAPRPPNWNY